MISPCLSHLVIPRLGLWLFASLHDEVGQAGAEAAALPVFTWKQECLNNPEIQEDTSLNPNATNISASHSYPHLEKHSSDGSMAFIGYLMV